MIDLAERLRPFREADLIETLPTRWQRVQGMLEMALYVASPDATDRERYRGARLGHPILRQPLSLWQVGPSHLRVGDGLGAPPIALFRHLMLVFHEGYPAYDLQLIQTHPDGLAHFRRFIDRVRNPQTGAERRLRRAMDWIIPDPPAYLDRFVSAGGHLERAGALEQPEPITGDPAARPEFATLIAFLNHCARSYPRRLSDLPARALPAHVGQLLTARLRHAGAPVAPGP